MLNLDFFYTSPIDFEYKNYILLDYLSQIDASYASHILSPYLLHTEKLITEIELFKTNIELFKSNIKKDIVGFSWNTGPIFSKVETSDELSEIIEIVDYSKPLLECKLKLGYKLFKKYPQLLY